MRACLLLCAALALAPSRPRAAAASHKHHPHVPTPEPARLEHIKTQILAKLGLSSRPTPLGAPPRDVVRQILARAADPRPERRPETEHSMREIIAIAHRVCFQMVFLGLEVLDIYNR
ncbi:uncharacterized protein LOC126777947 [Nymphalis io]|uniref:uncharacterized protein LOC126777947 n=1 Tax=Inachis io TaxID=171585 RepID=UPI00216A6936|nr:uncharacterized protein LOC126777947 [Nymphalis io]